MMSSTTPSAKYSCSGSPLMFVKGSTAMDGLSGDCQRRSGSAFAAQARWPEARIMLTGRSKAWSVWLTAGTATYQFCPDCGSTIAYIIEGWPGVVAVPVGAFADPTFPAPKFSVYEHRKHPWVVVLGEAVEHSSTPSVLRNPGSVKRASYPR